MTFAASKCAPLTTSKPLSMGLTLISLCLLLLLTTPSSASAQTVHSVTLAATASSDAAANPTLTYNVYRLNGACPATAPISVSGSGFTKKNTTPLATPSYTDSGIAPGAYCYFMTAFLNTVESIPSNTAQALVPVAVPTSLGVTSVL
jgi:hypothetical protein